MYTAYLEIHNFSQMMLVAPETVQKAKTLIDTYKRSCGSELKELGPGVYLCDLPVLRAGDTSYILNNLCLLRDHLLEVSDELYGFTLIVENCSGDRDEVLRQLRKLLLRTQLSNSLWMGPLLEAEFLYLVQAERLGGLQRVLSMKFNQEADYSAVQVQLASDEEYKTIRQLIQFELSHRVPRIRYMGFLGDEEYGISDLVQHAIQENVQDMKYVLWLIGQDPLDPPSVALLRGIFPQNLDEIEPWLLPEERSAWNLCRPFLFQTAFSPIEGLSPAQKVPEKAQEIFALGFRLLVLCLYRRSVAEKQCFVVHVENMSQFHPQALKILETLLSDFEKLTSLGSALILYSGIKQEDLGRSLSSSSIHVIKALNETSLKRMGIDLAKIPQSLKALQGINGLERRSALLLLQVLSHPEQKELSATSPEAIEFRELSWYGLRSLILTQLFKNLEAVLVEVLYVCTLCYGFLGVRQITDFLELISIDRIRVPGILKQLRILGFLKHEEILIPVFSDTEELLEANLVDRWQDIRVSLGEFLVEQVRQETLIRSLDTLILLRELSSVQDFFYEYFVYVRDCISVGDIKAADFALEYGSQYVQSLSDEGLRNPFELVMHGLDAACGLILEDTERIYKAVNFLDSKDSNLNPAYLCYNSLVKAKYVFLREGSESAQALVKNSIMLCQEKADLQGLAEAQLLFAYTLLGKERLLDAREYFVLAKNNGLAGAFTNEELWAECAEMQCNFILGFHSRVIAACDTSKSLLLRALQFGLFSMANFVRFTLGRSYFELGMYGQAIDVFQGGINKTLEDPAFNKLCLRWIQRAQFYGNKAFVQLDEDDSLEARLFEAERYVFQASWEKAAAVLQKQEAQITANLIPGILSWENGFAVLEDLLFPQSNDNSLSRLLFMLREYVRAQEGDPGVAANTVAVFNRNLKKNSADPQAYWYLYIQALCLEAENSGKNTDCATILGKAVKYLQERASRLENPAHKISFLHNNRRNAELLAEAKKFNLV